MNIYDIQGVIGAEKKLRFKQVDGSAGAGMQGEAHRAWQIASTARGSQSGLVLPALLLMLSGDKGIP